MVIVGPGSSRWCRRAAARAGRARRRSASRPAPWLTRRDFAPDEIRNNVRDWPMAVQKANQEVPTARPNASSPTTRLASHPMMNARRRHLAALLGAELAAEPVGLQGRQRNEAALRRVAHSGRVDGGRLAVRPRRARAVLREGRVRSRRVGSGRQRQRHDRSRAATPSRACASATIRCRRCAGPAFHREDGRSRRELARLASVSRSGRHQLALRTRIARAACTTASATRGGCHVDAKNSTAVTTIPARRGHRTA